MIASIIRRVCKPNSRFFHGRERKLGGAVDDDVLLEAACDHSLLDSINILIESSCACAVACSTISTSCV